MPIPVPKSKTVDRGPQFHMITLSIRTHQYLTSDGTRHACL